MLRNSLLLLLAFSLSAAALACRVWRTLRPIPLTSAKLAHLNLKIERADKVLQLTWNHSAVPDACAGLLSITDGHDKRELAMTAAQLRFETLRYEPSSDQVSFRLVLFGLHRQSVEASAMAIMPSRTVEPPITEVPGLESSGTAVRKFADEMKPISTRSGTSKQRKAPWAKASSVDRNSGWSIAIAQYHDPKLISAFPESSQPARARVSSQDRFDIAVSGLSAPVYDVPPRLVTELSAFEAKHLAMVANDTQIDVLVSVNSTGKVVSAKPVSVAGPFNASLVHSVAMKARLLMFEPARHANRKIPDQLIVQFKFTRS